MIPKANAVAQDFSARARPAALELPLGLPGPAIARETGHAESARPLPLFRQLVGWVARLRDVQLALLISAILFVASAWPLALTEVPPLQDLPNHLAAITIMQHPEHYPEFVFNGFFKTNAALFTWLFFASKVVGVKLAARVFTLMVLAVTVLIMPRFVLEVTQSRQKLVIASFFMWPMIHNWFVSMGMLDFALGLPLSMLVLALLCRQSRGDHAKGATWKLAALIAVAGLITWYAHVFTLMMAMLLAFIHVVTRPTWRERREQALRLIPPLVPAGALAMMSLYCHITEPRGAMVGWIDGSHKIAPWEFAYNLWAEYLWGFTKLSISSFVAAVLLFGIAVARRRQSPTFFSPIAMLVMIALYLALPYIATNWFHVNSRVIPFLWIGMLLRVPERLPKWTLGLLGLSAVLYSAGMGADYVRLDGDREKFVAGMRAVPERSRLLPLIFRQRMTSENTRSLLHAWGFYVVERETDAPLLFAHSRSFPVMYREPPPPRFNHLVLESFAPSMADSNWMCGSLRTGGIVVNCDAEWHSAWSAFWSDALPRYDHVLLWEPPSEVMAGIPPEYRVSFKQDQLVILERTPATVAGAN